MRLHGKFEIDNSWEWKANSLFSRFSNKDLISSLLSVDQGYCLPGTWQALKQVSWCCRHTWSSSTHSSWIYCGKENRMNIQHGLYKWFLLYISIHHNILWWLETHPVYTTVCSEAPLLYSLDRVYLCHQRSFFTHTWKVAANLNSLASEVSPAMATPTWLSIERIFFWWADSSDAALCWGRSNIQVKFNRQQGQVPN